MLLGDAKLRCIDGRTDTMYVDIGILHCRLYQLITSFAQLLLCVIAKYIHKLTSSGE